MSGYTPTDATRYRRHARTVDAYYEAKLAAGLLQRAHEVLSEVELEALMGGKYHGDGRRLDAYVTL